MITWRHLPGTARNIYKIYTQTKNRFATDLEPGLVNYIRRLAEGLPSTGGGVQSLHEKSVMTTQARKIL
ncbi:MAG: hypothetical protein HYR70_13110 [Chloroflexi bacterium]|nr:hypothetical protein [Chloroflexota bacterium]MBI3339569.1 hypothetical protein [Chloroflexota bacterium]